MLGVLDYLTQNAQLVYPFKDGVTLSNGVYTLPFNFLLDAQLTFKTVSGGRAYLSACNVNTGTHTATFIIKTLDQSDAPLSTSTFTADYSLIVEGAVLIFSNSVFNLKLIVGAGLVNYKAVTASNTYTLAQAEFSPSVVFLCNSHVNSIEFKNTEYNDMTLSYDSVSLSTQVGHIQVGEGANVSLALDSGVTALQVSAGLGSGLYNPCGGITDLYSVNFIAPDEYGNLLLATGDCYTTTKGYINGSSVFVPDHGITIANNCKPKCTPAMLTNFSHYLNRVKSAILSLGTYAGNLYTELLSEINTYYTTTLPANNSPTYKVKYAKSTCIGVHYYSFVVGIFNPSDTPLNFTTTVTATSPGFTFEPRFTCGTVHTEPSTVNFSDTVPCVSAGIFEFVAGVAVASTTTVTIVISGATAVGPHVFVI